jgi:hypothetical protein
MILFAIRLQNASRATSCEDQRCNSQRGGYNPWLHICKLMHQLDPLERPVAIAPSWRELKRPGLQLHFPLSARSPAALACRGNNRGSTTVSVNAARNYLASAQPLGAICALSPRPSTPPPRTASCQIASHTFFINSRNQMLAGSRCVRSCQIIDTSYAGNANGILNILTSRLLI